MTAKAAMKAWRKKLGITQHEAAEVLKCSQGLISRIESEGKRVSPETAIQIEELSNGALSRDLFRPDLWASKPEQVAA